MTQALPADNRSRRPSSLRVWLQTSTVLVVLAGYTALVVLTVSLSRMSRRQDHQVLIDRVSVTLIQRVRSAAEFDAVSRRMLLPGLEVRLVPPAPETAPRLIWNGEQVVLESVSPLILRDGLPRGLLLRQDVSDSIAQQNLSLQLLAAGAAASVMLTGLLLRPVLRIGLVEPLQTLNDQLSAYRSVTDPPPPLDVEAQPEELRPIATTFNAMQERLTSSWERQRTFVDGVAHELRTPITLISGHAQSLQRQNKVAALAPSLALITAEARRMGSMVSDMLDMARKDAGRLQLRRQAIDVEDALLEAFERLAPSAEGRLRLQPPGEDESLPLAAGDPERLAQCLVALIDNALRYSPAPAPIQLSLEAIGSGPAVSRGLAVSPGPAVAADTLVAAPTPATAALVIHVMDRGPGVPPEERQAIFERFVRGGAAVDTRGSGIGLAVVQLLMEAMGGKVMVSEAPGGGADFQLHLPLFEGPAQILPPSIGSA